MRRQYIYNKVKRLALVSLLYPFSSLFFSSCADFLEIKPQSEIILEDFWNEKADVDAVVAGCYSALQADPVIRRMMVWGEFRSENVMAGSDADKDINLQNVLKENITAKNYYTTWDGFYTVINRCNTVIKYAPSVAERDPGYTESELKATIAEVSALRDLCYFYLIRTFRDVPYTTEAVTDDDQEMQLPATDFDTVLNYLIADLESIKGNAIVRYPETKPEYQTGRITRNAINAMLCEMYLWKKDYQSCINYADMVIDFHKQMRQENKNKGGMSSSNNDDRTNGYPLVSNAIANNVYGSAFNEIFVNGNSEETIFELIYDNLEAGYSMPSNSAAGEWYGNANVAQGRVAPSNYVVEDKDKENQRGVFADENKKLDARMYYNFTASGDICKMVYQGVQISTSGSSASVFLMGKYPKANNPDRWYTSSNWIIYRLSDIMLLKAEALCQQMLEGSDEEVVNHNAPLIETAFELVDAVNKRSLCDLTASYVLNSKNYTTKSQMQDLVMKERQRELMFEGKRWYDLVRRSLRDGNNLALISAISHRDGPNSQLMQTFFGNASLWDRAIFWPYNYDETVVNKQLRQNPAYGDGMNSSIK